MVWGDPDMKVNKVVTHEDYRLMAEFDINMSRNETELSIKLSDIYRRAGVQKSDYPMDLFKT